MVILVRLSHMSGWENFITLLYNIDEKVKKKKKKSQGVGSANETGENKWSGETD